jgi:hypothetical protein
MPAAVHKVLMHGEAIIKWTVLPIEKNSEDASEAKNKEYKYARLNNTRKCSISATIEDLIHSLLVSSDPFISSFRHSLPKKSTELNEEAIDLLDSDEIDYD